MLNQAVLDACDARDGVKDGFLEQPARLHVRSGDAAVPQAATTPRLPDAAAGRDASSAMYAPATHAARARSIFPGKEPGSETGWNVVAGGAAAALASRPARSIVAYNDAELGLADLRPRSRPAASSTTKIGVHQRRRSGPAAFKARGGKLLLYHGWNDTAISPGNTIDYYSSVLEKMGPEQGRLAPPVHGARHGALRRRRRPQPGGLSGRRSNGGANRAWRRAS